MNLIKIIFGLILIGVVISYPVLGTAGLMAIGIPLPIVLVLGLGFLIGGVMLIIGGLAENR